MVFSNLQLIIRSTYRRNRTTHFAAFFLTICVAGQAQQQRPFGLDSLADFDPKLDCPKPTYEIPQEMIATWATCLNKDEFEIQQRTAELIAQAKRFGMLNLETLLPHLRRILARPIEDRSVHLAVSHALAELDDKQSAERLLTIATALGGDAAAIVEPRLAAWKYEPAYKIWRKRLGSSSVTRSSRILAIQGLGTASDRSAKSDLELLAKDPRQPTAIRLEAAKAISNISDAGNESFAKRLLNENSHIGKLAAVEILMQHKGLETIGLLTDTSFDNEYPAVQRLALGRLIKIAPTVVANRFEEIANSDDPMVRLLAIQSLELFADSDNAKKIAAYLGDHHPAVRNTARDVLFRFSSDSSAVYDAVAQQLRTQLNSQSWRALQQASRLAGQMDYEPAAMRCVALLEHLRPDVHTTAAWSLRKLQVSETLASALRHLNLLVQWTHNAPPSKDDNFRPYEADAGSYQEDVAQLAFLMGLTQYEDAEPTLRRYIPKDCAPVTCRVGAIMGLGYLHRDSAPKSDLATLITQRLDDVNPMMPELMEVRAACAVALGHMKAKSALPRLRHFYELETTATSSGYGCAWAIEQITKEKVAYAGKVPAKAVGQFFIMPTK